MTERPDISQRHPGGGITCSSCGKRSHPGACERPANATEWAEMVSEMLLTYSRDPRQVLDFADEHGVIKGAWVEHIDWDQLLITVEDGWIARYDAAAHRFAAVL